MMQTQTEVAKACCSEVQTDESAVTLAEREAVLCAQNASISAQLKKAAEYTETVEAALREAQRSAEARECSFESEAESLRARIAELEAAVQSYQSQQQQKNADALERMAVGDGSGYGTDRAMLVKLVSKRLLKAEATIASCARESHGLNESEPRFRTKYTRESADCESVSAAFCDDDRLYRSVVVRFDLSVSHLRLTADVTIIGRSRAVSRARTRSRGPRRDHDATRRDAPAASRHAKRAARATDFRAFV